MYIKSTIRVSFDIIRSGAEVQSSHYFPGPARVGRAGPDHRYYLLPQWWLAKFLLANGGERKIERGCSGVDAEFKQAHFLSLARRERFSLGPLSP